MQTFSKLNSFRIAVSKFLERLDHDKDYDAVMITRVKLNKPPEPVDIANEFRASRQSLQ